MDGSAKGAPAKIAKNINPPAARDDDSRLAIAVVIAYREGGALFGDSVLARNQHVPAQEGRLRSGQARRRRENRCE